MALNLSKLAKRHVKNSTWPKEKKLQAVVQYLALGNMNLVAATTGISYGLLRQWKMQPWWAEFEKEVRNTENLQLDNKLTKIVERSLEAVADRLDNGDPVWDSKTGSVQRKPVSMKDSAKVATDLLTKRELLRGNATSRTEATVPMADQLKLLAAEFARMTSGKPTEVIDVETVEILNGDVEDATADSDDLTGEEDAVHEEWEEGLQERTPMGEDLETYEAGGPGGSEPGTFGSDEGRTGEEGGREAG